MNRFNSLWGPNFRKLPTFLFTLHNLLSALHTFPDKFCLLCILFVVCWFIITAPFYSRPPLTVRTACWWKLEKKQAILVSPVTAVGGSPGHPISTIETCWPVILLPLITLEAINASKNQPSCNLSNTPGHLMLAIHSYHFRVNKCLSILFNL